MKQSYYNMVAAFSLANLILIEEWRQPLLPGTKLYFSYLVPPSGLVSILAMLGLFGIIAFALLEIADKAKRLPLRRVATVLLLALFSLVMEHVRRMTNVSVNYPTFSLAHFLGDFGVFGNRIKWACLVAISLLVVWRCSERFLKAMHGLLLVCLPVLLLNLMTVSRMAFLEHGDRFETVGESAVRTSHQPRVIWMIFDELDETLSFAKRPVGVDLPAFDRLRAESFVASRAYPPSTATRTALPSLTTGKLVQESNPMSAAELGVRFCSDTKEVPWGQQPTIFSDARGMGMKTSLVGWYLPYCRNFHGQVDNCFSAPMLEDSYRRHFIPNVVDIWNRVFYGPASFQVLHEETHERVFTEASHEALNANIDFLFVHWPIPHHPQVWDSHRAKFHYPANAMVEGYYNNLLLADETLRKLREEMEAKGIWEKTTLVISADHFFRFPPKGYDNGISHLTVPYIIKFAGETQSVAFAKPFGTVVTRGLIDSILRGTVKNAQQAADWLSHYQPTMSTSLAYYKPTSARAFSSEYLCASPWGTYRYSFPDENSRGTTMR